MITVGDLLEKDLESLEKEFGDSVAKVRDLLMEKGILELPNPEHIKNLQNQSKRYTRRLAAMKRHEVQCDEQVKKANLKAASLERKRKLAEIAAEEMAKCLNH